MAPHWTRCAAVLGPPAAARLSNVPEGEHVLAQQVIELSGPDGLRLVDLDEPAADGRVVVDLHAAGVSYPDLLQATGAYQLKRPLPFVPGAEGAGVVRSAPGGCGLVAGQRVAVFGAGGTWQKVVALDPAQVFPLPDTVSLDAGAGMLVNYLTVHLALRRRARAEKHETVLVHGAAGGVGTAALHLCRALDLRSIAVVSDSRKADAARAAGADDVVLTESWLDSVRYLTSGRGVDIVLDPVGGDRFTDSMRSLAAEGRVVVIGFVGGEIPTVKVNRLLLGNTAVLGAGLGEILRHDLGYLEQAWGELEALLVTGALTVPEPTVYDLADAATALRALSARAAVGKIVLRLR